MQCLKLLGSYNILSACVVGLSECACASYVAILDHTKHRDNAGSAGMCERTLYICAASHTYIMLHVPGAGRQRTSADGRHQATSDDIAMLSWTLSRYRDKKKVHDSSPSTRGMSVSARLMELRSVTSGNARLGYRPR